jgi:DNA modification methylase
MTEFGSYVAADEASVLLARDSRGCKDFVVDAVGSPPVPRVRFVSLIESERLHGFPDGWTRPLDTDGARRKALGNAVTVTAARWVLDRAVSTIPAESGSGTSTGMGGDEDLTRSPSCRTQSVPSGQETPMDMNTLFDPEDAAPVDPFDDTTHRDYDLLRHEQTVEYDKQVATGRSAVVCGDASEILAAMPEGCVRTVVTSPPYWGHRDYDDPAQIGHEETVFAYIDRLVELFEGVRRVLADDGSLWLNIGDSYTSGGRRTRMADRNNAARTIDFRPDTPEGMKPKDLIGVPWMLAFALREAGWYLRTEILWNKPNCQPESVRDRPTRSHEYLFLLTKSQRYHYDVDAVTGPNGRRNRTIWDINTVPLAEHHDAAFPPELVYTCLAHGSERDDLVLDPFLGSGTTAMVAGSMGRRFFGIELNPDYVSIITRRLRGSVAA